VDSGHGTHVAVSAVGAGNTNGVGEGTAPGARLVFQAVENLVNFVELCAGTPSGYYLFGIPYDIRELFQQAYDDGARIHSDSWGTPTNPGIYDIDSHYVDDFIWHHPEMTITYSAGNSGDDFDHDGYVDTAVTSGPDERYYLSTPATAKNLITVGASENDRQGHYECDPIATFCTGINEIFWYGWAWPLEFDIGPIASDLTAGNAEQMAGFSSRGPTKDNRIKPDIVAPGTWVLSGYSDLYQEYYDADPNPETGEWQSGGWFDPLNAQYKYLGGTSMSTPLVAGGAAVVREYYAVNYEHAASAALVKATLINSAVDMLDENNDGQSDNDIPIPNNHEGWGRMELHGATNGSREYKDVNIANGLATGDTVTYQYIVKDPAAPLKVSLVWSDYPSTETAAINLVNDLDLGVRGPDGQLYLGNVFSEGWSQTGGDADRTNNVENVYISSPASGTWTITVSGFNVPMGPQSFALVFSNAAESARDDLERRLLLWKTLFRGDRLGADSSNEDGANTGNSEGADR
jgi:subtilisin family serine protease